MKAETKKRLLGRLAALLLAVAFITCASLLAATSQAQNEKAKKGFKIANNEAVAEDGFEFVRVSDKEGRLVKSKTARTHSDETTLGSVTINCTCNTPNSGLIVKC
ncbi:MAG: hypothetical protein M3X11_13830, partial [Acidobacteriota bacterium]|nr:hypothetical protein [Acidobacteriota bacterium]